MSDQSVVLVVGIFANRGQAERVIDVLHHAGFARECIGFATPERVQFPAQTANEAMEETAASGAVRGAVAGGALGALVGCVALVLPGVGPILSAGLLVGMAAAAGAAIGSFAGPFVALGISEEKVKHYESTLRGGRSIVVILTDKPEQAMTVLQEHGPIFTEIVGQEEVLAGQK